MKKIQMKILSLALGAGILLTSFPGYQALSAEPESAIDQTKKQIMTMTDSIHQKEDKITELSDAITMVGENISKNEQDITGLNGQIEATHLEIEDAQGDLSDKEALYGKRLREVYKNGNTSVLGTILGARNLSDLLLRFKAVDNIARHDKELIDSIEALKRTLEEKRNQLEETRTRLETATQDLKNNQNQLSQNKQDQEQELNALKTEKSKLRELLMSQEVALFEEIQRILNSKDSTEEEINDALAILETIQAQVSTAEAVELGRQLESQGRELSQKLAIAREEAERLAREKEEAERKARELERQKKLDEARQAKEEATRKEKERLEAEARADALESEKDKQEDAAEKLAAEEAQAKEAADQAKEIADQNSGSSSENNLTFYLSFYTDLPEENGGWTITATGDKLVYGVVANNVWPLYTKIYLEGWGTMTVKDRGGSHFYNRYRLDVFIPRKSGETNTQYKARISNLGRQTAKGRIVK